MSLFITIKVIAQASKEAFVMDKSGVLKCYVFTPAVDGKANKAVIALLAKKLGIAKSAIQIVSGLISPKKRLAIDTSMTHEQVLLLLDCPVQTSL